MILYYYQVPLTTQSISLLRVVSLDKYSAFGGAESMWQGHSPFVVHLKRYSSAVIPN